MPRLSPTSSKPQVKRAARSENAGGTPPRLSRSLCQPTKWRRFGASLRTCLGRQFTTGACRPGWPARWCRAFQRLGVNQRASKRLRRSAAGSFQSARRGSPRHDRAHLVVVRLRRPEVPRSRIVTAACDKASRSRGPTLLKRSMRQHISRQTIESRQYLLSTTLMCASVTSWFSQTARWISFQASRASWGKAAPGRAPCLKR